MKKTKSEIKEGFNNGHKNENTKSEVIEGFNNRNMNGKNKIRNKRGIQQQA